MTRMVPDRIGSDVAASERRVHQMIQDLPETDDWICLHSLGLSSAWTGDYGELDFLLLVPRVGLIVVEVKGGGISVRNGTWTTRDRYGRSHSLKRSPFRQAQDGVWKLLSALRKKFGDNAPEAKCPIGWTVVFPDVQCPALPPEATRGEVVDRDDLDGDLRRRLLSLPSLAALASRTDLEKPSQAIIDRVLRFLRPEFEQISVPVSERWDAEEQIRTLTEEQFAVLDGIADNACLLIQGPAGTGKTLLGLESARRAVLSGKRVLMTCYNANLGRWLHAATRGQPMVAGNIHALLRERIQASPLAADLAKAESSSIDNANLYGHVYFELGALAIEATEERFDHIVVDEVQDVASKPLCDVVKAWSSDRAHVVFVGDFSRQAIYAGAAQASPELLDANMGRLASFNLTLNCRNTRRIANQLAVLSGFAGHRLSDRQPEGDQVSVNFFENDDAGLRALETIVLRLRDAGHKASEVVVLGPRRRDKSFLRSTKAIGGWQLVDFDEEAAGLRYETIHSFKGLESPVVIIVEGGASTADESDALLYVGMSRARLKLFVLVRESNRTAIEARLTAAALAAAGIPSGGEKSA